MTSDLTLPASPVRRVLAIAGSLRNDSWNRRLLEAAARHAPPGLRIEVATALQDVPVFNEDLERGGGPATVRALRERVREADGLLIATPEYNQSIPGVLKNLIDWLSRAAPDEPLAGKPVAIVGATGGRWGTRLAQQALRHTLAATESLVMPAPALYLRDVASLFDGDGTLADAETAAALRKVLDAFAQWIDRVSPLAPVHAVAMPLSRHP